MSDLDLAEFGITETEDGYQNMTNNVSAKTMGKIGTKKTAKVFSATKESFDEGPKMVLLLAIDGEKDPKKLPLNKTNLKNMLDAFGKDPDKWVNQKVELRVERVQMNGVDTPGIRVHGL